MVETLPPNAPASPVPQEVRELGSMYVQSCVELAEDFERVGLAAMPPQLVQIAANLVLKGFNRTTLLGHISRRDLRATGDMNTLRLRLLMHDGWGAKRWGPDAAQALDLSGIRLSSIDEDVACAAGPSDPTLAASPESIQRNFDMQCHTDMQSASHSDREPLPKKWLPTLTSREAMSPTLTSREPLPQKWLQFHCYCYCCGHKLVFPFLISSRRYETSKTRK